MLPQIINNFGNFIPVFPAGEKKYVQADKQTGENQAIFVFEQYKKYVCLIYLGDIIFLNT